jgi:hypothetical protein
VVDGVWGRCIVRFNKTNKPPLGSQINFGHPLAKGLIGYWLMNEGSGSIVKDYSAYGRDGIFNQAAYPGWVTGPMGQQLKFTASADKNRYIECASATNFTENWNKGSVVSWILSRGQWDVIISNGNFSTDRNGVTVAIDASYKFALELADSSSYQLVSSTVAVPTVGVVFNVATWNGVDIRLYQNGALNCTITAQTKNPVMGVYPLIIGQAGSKNSDVFDYQETIISISIYNRALPAHEVASLYNAPYAMFDRRPAWMDYTEPPVGTEYRMIYHNHYQQMRMV